MFELCLEKISFPASDCLNFPHTIGVVKKLNSPGKDDPQMNLPLLKKSSPPKADELAPTSKSKSRNLLKHLGKKRIIALVLACALGVWAWGRFFGATNGPDPAADQTYTTAAVERRDITSAITGSGSLEAANSYSVTALVEGTILTADFEEGDTVEEGTVLYTIDSSDSSSSLEQAQISLEQAQRSYNKQLESQGDLNVSATAAGRVYSIDVAVGDEVQAGQTVATVRDSDTMTLEVNFPADEAQNLSVGQAATVTLDSTFETLSGTVTKVGGSTQVLTGNVQVRTVTIEVANPGGLSTSQSASAAVGGLTSTGSGTFTYSQEKTITAKVSGEVAALRVSEGDRVTKGQTLIVLTSDDLDDAVQNASESLRNAQLNLENRYDQLDDYTITSPIAGTIIDKNYKAGETSDANQVLCTIYDLSYLTMTLSVDELDISNIEVGQTVSITADAVEDKTYEGVVTKVSVAGAASNGVTTYPVTIRIDETDGLLPGMNVDAEITLNSASDVLAIPSAALNRGNTVLVTADSPSAANAASDQTSGQAAPDGDKSGAMDGQKTENADTPNPDAKGGQASSEYVSVSVTTGVSDGDYIEITSGLQEGDTVVYISTSSSSQDFAMMMPGGMPSGGSMPAGGGGGMPGGGQGGGPGGF